MKPFFNISSPGKLNLFLHITGRRADGYHTLQTVFQLLDFGDELQLRSIEQPHIQLNTAFENVKHDENLIVRAAKLLQKHSQTTMGAEINCIKRLPMGGGLGGGSSNAASTLLALNHLWQTGLSLNELAELGLTLGADVPVFVRGHSAWAEGIGEQLTPIDLTETWYVVLIPQCSISTAEIFHHPQLTRNTSAITIAAFFEGGGHNDCQPVVANCYPQVQQTLDWLGNFSTSRLTGTGSAVFASFPKEEDARAVLAQLPATLQGQEIRGFVARGVNRSPAHEQLRSE